MFDVNAVDRDLGSSGNITYILLGPSINLFTIDSATGEIRVSSAGLDFEMINPTGNPLQFTLIAQDAGKLFILTLSAHAQGL